MVIGLHKISLKNGSSELAPNWNLQVPRAFLIWSIKENANHEIQKADLANPWFEFQSQFWFLKF
jgi:hypothetical protein|tara:strand:+ start:421 stop:612 length:192 start_codon:yes stop_codon:yes gene_type:complete